MLQNEIDTFVTYQQSRDTVLGGLPPTRIDPVAVTTGLDLDLIGNLHVPECDPISEDRFDLLDMLISTVSTK